ncbi:unnamed protein product, partial [Allacma fusca]
MQPDQTAYFTISSDNFCSIKWQNQTNISFDRCLHELTLINLTQCCYTLRNANFSNLTKISNLKRVLIHCPNINTITFNETLIDEYRQLKPPATRITHGRISELKIIRPLELSRHEYWLLDFFTNQVDLTRIKALSFYCFTTIGGANTLLNDAGRDPNVSRPGINFETIEVMNQYGGFNNNKTVLEFITKYQKTLKTLWIGRPGFELGTSVPNLQELSLTFLNVSLGSSGVKFLLETQQNLEILSLVTKLSLKEYSASTISDLMSTFFCSIRLNVGTLREIQIIPTLISGELNRSDLFSVSILDNFKIDCAMFSDCKNLQHLCLSLRAYRHEMDMWVNVPPILQGTKLVNIQNVPVTLSELY